MCGIVGFFNKNYVCDPQQIDSAIESIQHRGPDGSGVETTQYGFLGHTRLSIIDTAETGKQPFVKLDGKVIVAHNGEIYNHLELRSSLTNQYPYNGHSDSEVIPYLYHELGINDMTTKLEGMFAICVVDLENKVVYLVRDTFGIKPLYYLHHNGGLYFGSEIKSLKALAPCKLTIHEQSILDFLCLGYIVDPHTIYNEIKAVPPGSILKFDILSGSISTVNFTKNEDSQGDKADQDSISLLLTEIIRQQSAADVPIGVFLSGGVDSTLVASYFASVNSDVSSFTVKFDSPERDESIIAAQSAHHLRTKHHELHIKERIDWNQMIQLLLHFDQPFGDLSFIPTFAISQEVKKSIKVVLSGDGGDEFAGGYPKFRYFKTLQSYTKITPPPIRKLIYNILELLPNLNKLKKFASLSIQKPEEQLFGLSTYTPENEARALLKYNSKLSTPARHFSFNDSLDYAQNVTVNQCATSLPSKMLVKVDRMSMLAGIEVRVPLLDTRFTSKLLTLPHSHKLNRSSNKLILRTLLKKILPAYSNPKKIGFDFDYKELTSQGWESKMMDELRRSFNSNNTAWKYLDQKAVDNWLHNYETGSIQHTSKQSQFQLLFNIYALYKWFSYSTHIEDNLIFTDANEAK